MKTVITVSRLHMEPGIIWSDAYGVALEAVSRKRSRMVRRWEKRLKHFRLSEAAMKREIAFVRHGEGWAIK